MYYYVTFGFVLLIFIMCKYFQKLEQLFQLWQDRIKQMQQEMEQQYNSVSCKRTVAMDKLMEKRSQVSSSRCFNVTVNSCRTHTEHTVDITLYNMTQH